MQGSENDVRVRTWKTAALADGWAIKPTYGEHESVDRAASLEKDGYNEGSIPEKLQKKPEASRDGESQGQLHYYLRSSLDLESPVTTPGFSRRSEIPKLCSECGQVKPQTSRVGFANRVCDDCKPAAKAKYEKPGWCD